MKLDIPESVGPRCADCGHDAHDPNECRGDVDHIEAVKKLREWICKQRYLPAFLRDFHAQKDVFKAVGKWRECSNVSWVDGHIYTIDHFLKFMAMHGYTLRRTRADLSFCDLDKSVEEMREHEAEVLRKMLSSRSDPGGEEGRR